MPLRRVEKILSRLYDGLPTNVRKTVSPGVEPVFLFVRRFFRIVSQVRLPTYLLQGREKGGGHPLTALFVGDETGVLYVSDLLFSEEPVKKELGNIFIWKIRSGLNSDLPPVDLLFVKVDGVFSWWLSRHGLMILPEWVLFLLDLTRPLSEIWNLSKNKNLRENLREIRKQQYTYELTCDPEKFNFFYHQMYLPYVALRYGRFAEPHSFSYLKRIFERGRLLLIKNGEEPIAGSIIRTEPQGVRLVHSGVRGGEIEYLKRGAHASTYYFATLWAKERGYPWLDAGHCRPFLRDGVFFHKKSWGMEIKRSNRVQTVFGLKVGNLQPGVASFLTRNPFVFVDQGKLKGLVFSDEDHPLSVEEAQSFLRSYSIPGLEGLVLLSSRGFSLQAEVLAASQKIPRLELIQGSPEIYFRFLGKN